MNTRDVIWLSTMVAFIVTVAGLVHAGVVDLGANGWSTPEYVTLGGSVLLIGLLTRHFVRHGFDEDGSWRGSVFRRRREGGERQD